MDSTPSSAALTLPANEIPAVDVEFDAPTYPEPKAEHAAYVAGQPLPLRDPVGSMSPRPFPFDPPTQLRAPVSERRRHPTTMSARRLAIPTQPWFLRVVQPHVAPFIRGALALGLVFGAGFVFYSTWAKVRSLTSVGVADAQLREFDVDAGLDATRREPAALNVADTQSAASASLERHLEGPGPNTQVLGSVHSGSSGRSKPDAETLALIRKAVSGEDAALLQLELKSSRERTFDDLLAIAEGREVQARRDAKDLAKEFAAMDPLRPNHELIDELLKAAADPYTYREAQLGLARHSSSLGPDLLYQVIRQNRYNDVVTEFAQMLLASEDVYARSSDALKVAIAAWDTRECSDARKLLSRAVRFADNRAVRPLAKFAQTSGCGKDNAEDCYPCLREDGLLVEALKAAQSRRPPR